MAGPPQFVVVDDSRLEHVGRFLNIVGSGRRIVGGLFHGLGKNPAQAMSGLQCFSWCHENFSP
jgi:hypothetical protein